MLDTGYSEEFCIASDFSPEFIAGLMEAGFLVMSAKVTGPDEEEDSYILLPKLHLERSALFFENLHVKKSVRRLLNCYELRFDNDFYDIVDRCLEVHGDGWLTPPLINAIKYIRLLTDYKQHPVLGSFFNVRPVSFALYRDGKLVAGEFGISTCRAANQPLVYTSYSGYYDESNAGTVQLIKATQFLRDNGYAFFDLGMPLDYKNDLGAVNISPEEFVQWFRNGAP